MLGWVGLGRELYIPQVHRAQRPAPLGHLGRVEERPPSQNCFLPSLVVTHRKPRKTLTTHSSGNSWRSQLAGLTVWISTRRASNRTPVTMEVTGQIF